MIKQVLAAASAVLLMAGCRSTFHSAGTSSPPSRTSGFPSTPARSTTSAPAALIFTAPPADVWAQEIDVSSHIRFDLPGSGSAQPADFSLAGGRKVPERIYQYGFPNGTSGVSVGIVGGGSQHVSIDLGTYPSTLRDQLLRAGSPSASVSEVKQFVLDGHQGIDYQLSFTTFDGSKKGIWLTRVIADKDVYVVAETDMIDADPVPSLPGLRSVQSRLVAGIKLV